MARILIVEDDQRLAALTSEFLTKNGFSVEIESRGDQAVERILRTRPDLVILDVMLPGEDGLSVCRRSRSQYGGPILMLTARDDDIDEVLGLEVGADDYLTKPTNPRVLLARVNALLRRRGPTPPEARTRIELGGFVANRTRREVTLDGLAIPLTSTEFDVLCFLAERAGEVVSRETLYAELKGTEYDRIDRSIDMCISKVRQKLGAAAEIKAVRGVGYQFVVTSG